MEITYKNIITKNEAFRMVLYLLIGVILCLFILFKHFYSLSLSNREYTSSFIVLAAMLILSLLSGIFQIFLYFRLIYSVSFDKEMLLIDFMYGKNKFIDINSIDFL